MKKTDLAMVAVVLAFFVFVFRYQISGFFGYGGIGFIETGGMGLFQETDEEVCTEDGKAIIYFFGSTGCGHCMWERPILQSVLSEFEGYISLHENIDNDNERDISAKYGNGSPLIIIGCRFFRAGSGENLGEAAERMVLRNLICQVTDAPQC